jgi:hypothetical protein
MLLRERRTLPRKFTTSIACDLETKEWLRVYAQKYKMTLAEALYEIVNRTVAIEEGIAKGPKLRT